MRKEHLSMLRKILAASILLIILPVLTVWAADENPQHAHKILKSYGPSNPERAAQKQLKGSTDSDAIKVPILIYHAIRPYRKKDTAFVKEFVVTPDGFERHLQYLQNNGYTVISYRDLELYFSQKKPLPAKPVIITFDDGWQDQFTYAFPLLKKYHDTATFYVFSNAIGHKYFLTWPQIKLMDENGMTIGGHTRTHPFLFKIKDPKKLTQEIAGGKQDIEKHLGKPIYDFAFPFGHYNTLILNIVQKAGFTTARSTYRGAYHSKKTIYTLTGYIVPDNLKSFASMMTNVPQDRLPVLDGGK